MKGNDRIRTSTEIQLTLIKVEPEAKKSQACLPKTSAATNLQLTPQKLVYGLNASSDSKLTPLKLRSDKKKSHAFYHRG